MNLRTVVVLMLFGAVLTRPSVGYSLEGEPYKPMKHLWLGAEDLADTPNAVILALGSLATAVSIGLADDRLKNYFDRHERLGGAEKFGDLWGNEIFAGSVGVATLGGGLLLSRQKEVNVAEAYLEALVVNFGLTIGLKYGIDRKRPNGVEGRSFPSSHASTAFVMAGSLTRNYGIGAGLPAILLGGFTAVSRMSERKHYLSDVIFGATLGFVIGRAYAGHHLSQEKALSWLVVPYFESRKEFGVVARVSF